MKQCIAALLILLLMFGAALWNTREMCALTERMSAEAAAAEASALAGDFQAAAAQLSQAATDWESAKKYTYVFTRHTAVDAVSDLCSDALAELYKEDGDAIRGVFRKLQIHLRSIADMERIQFGSIF